MISFWECKSSTIFSKSGYLSDDEKNLILIDGNIQKLDQDGNVSIVKFEKTTFKLSGISTKSIRLPKMQETSTIQIIRCMQDKNAIMRNCNPTKKSEMDVKIEFNKRFGMPFFIPLLALACCFLLTSQKDEKTYSKKRNRKNILYSKKRNKKHI